MLREQGCQFILLYISIISTAFGDSLQAVQSTSQPKADIWQPSHYYVHVSTHMLPLRQGTTLYSSFIHTVVPILPSFLPSKPILWPHLPPHPG
jgi:hypothetical protein